MLLEIESAPLSEDEDEIRANYVLNLLTKLCSYKIIEGTYTGLRYDINVRSKPTVSQFDLCTLNPERYAPKKQ